MKRFSGGKMKLLSLLLSLVLVVGMVSTMLLSASAFEPNISASAGNTQYYDSGCLKSIDISVKALYKYADAYGKIAVHNGTSSYDYFHAYASNGAFWPDLSGDPTFVALGSGGEFEWTDMKLHTMTVLFQDGQVKMDQNKTYPVYLWTRSTVYGVYPDKHIGDIKIGDEGLKFNNDFVDGNNSVVTHSHSWQITGDNTDTLTAACVGQQGTCTAGGPVSVSIAASGVTLPNSPFNASVSNVQQFEAVTGLKVHPLDYLQRPGYKYKAVGASSFADPDMSNPKAGTYQAIIYVEDANGAQHSAFVQYQAIDPIQTAATGDNRPIEIMFMGLLACLAMAVAAFVMDSKRRASR